MTQYRMTLNGKPITGWHDHRTIAILDANKQGYEVDMLEIEERPKPATPIDVVGDCFKIMGL